MQALVHFAKVGLFEVPCSRLMMDKQQERTTQEHWETIPLGQFGRSAKAGPNGSRFSISWKCKPQLAI